MMRRMSLSGRRAARSSVAFSVFALVGVSLALGVKPAYATDPMVGIRALAMGDSLRGNASGDEGTLLNPSGIALSKQFFSSGFYSFRSQSNGHFLHASVSDSVTQQYLAIGLYYNFFHESPHFAYRLGEGGASSRVLTIGTGGSDITRSGNEAGFVIALPLGDRFAMGGTLKYGNYSLYSSLHPSDVPADFTYQNPAIDAEHNVDLGSVGNVVSFDLGMTLRIVSDLRLGIVGQNLWAHGFELPSRLGMGLAYRLNERFIAAFDAMIDFTGSEICATESNGLCAETARRLTYRLGGGVEYVAAGKVPLRLGYLYDSTLNANHVSGGLGYLDAERGFGLDFSLRQRVSAGNETVFLLGLRIIKN